MYTDDRKYWKVCPDCNHTSLSDKWFADNIGDGKCRHCEGDGTNHTFLIREALETFTGEPGTCEYSSGTGQCQTCGGEGRVKIRKETGDNDDGGERDDEYEASEDDSDNDSDSSFSGDYSYNSGAGSGSYSGHKSSGAVKNVIIIAAVLVGLLLFVIYRTPFKRAEKASPARSEKTFQQSASAPQRQYSWSTCPDCKGNKKVLTLSSCPECNGQGYHTCPVCSGSQTQKCDLCNGEGTVDCSWCGGEGRPKCTMCNGTGITADAWNRTFNCTKCAGDGFLACNTCSGSGKAICSKCKGSKKMKCNYCSLHEGIVSCDKCYGKKEIEEMKPCQTCGGKGQIKNEK